jgi:hypothetical protein
MRCEVLFNNEELIDQMEYEISDLAKYGFDKPINLSKLDTAAIAKLLINKDQQIKHLFDMDPEIVLIHIDDDHYDWADFHNQLINVIEWYNLNPLIKIFSPIK